MTKPLPRLLLKRCILMVYAIALSGLARAQTAADALMIPKNYFCAAAEYSDNQWTNYWEGTFKRDNHNIGTLTTNTAMIGGNYGITNKLDVLFSVPYVYTNASSGTLKGQHGLQDLSVSVKWMAFITEIGKGIFSAHAILSGSVPLTNYEADFLPLSIGSHAETVSGRALLNYQVGRIFVAGAAQYTVRSDIYLEQNAYYTTQEIYSNKVYMPNMNNFLFSAGYRSLKFNAEAIYSQYTTLGGFDIRKNDMPFPSNTMNMSTIGGLLKYSFDGLTGLELTAGSNYVLTGRNVGQSTTVWGGALYVFEVAKHNKNTKNK